MPVVARDRRRRGGEVGGDAGDFGLVGVAELDAEAHLAGDDVAAVRRDDELADGAAAVLAAGAHDAVHEVDDAGGADQRVAARRGGRGAGMAVLAGGDRVVPDLRLRAGDDADLLVLALEDRALLDMQLEIGVGGEGRGGLRRRDSRSRRARRRR